MKKALAILLLLAGGAFVGWRYWPLGGTPAEAKAQAKPVSAAVRKGELRVEIETTGSVVANQEVQIKCKASGEIIKLPLDVSERVGKGSLLVQLDPEDEQRSVKRSEVKLAVSQARLTQAKLNLRIAEQNLKTDQDRAKLAVQTATSDLQEAKVKFEGRKALLAKDLVSREDYEAMRAAFTKATANLATARVRLEELETQREALKSRQHDIAIAAAQVETDKLSLEDTQQRLKDTTVLAPRSISKPMNRSTLMPRSLSPPSFNGRPTPLPSSGTLFSLRLKTPVLRWMLNCLM